MPRRNLLLPIILLVASGVDSQAAGQEWAARFPRHPECDTKRSHVRNQALGPTGTLIVHPVVFGTDTAIEYAIVNLLPGTEPEPLAATPRPVDLSPFRVFSGVAPGTYRVMAFAIGYAKRSDTLTIQAGFVDTLRLPMPLIDDAVRNRHNCDPRGFRRAGEPVCITDSTADWQMGHARSLATPSERALFKLPPGDSTKVELVRDEKICARAAELYGEKGDPPRRVIVFRMDNVYLVYDPFEPVEAGEWDIHIIFDLRWRVVARLAA